VGFCASRGPPTVRRGGDENFDLAAAPIFSKYPRRRPPRRPAVVVGPIVAVAESSLIGMTSLNPTPLYGRAPASRRPLDGHVTRRRRVVRASDAPDAPSPPRPTPKIITRRSKNRAGGEGAKREGRKEEGEGGVRRRRERLRKS
jgi:hypothetical protein